MKGNRAFQTKRSQLAPSSKSLTLSQKVIGIVVLVILVWLLASFYFVLSVSDRGTTTTQTTPTTQITTTNNANNKNQKIIFQQQSTKFQKFKATTEKERNYDWYERSKWVIENNKRYLETSYKGEGNITLVSGLFDLGRGDLETEFKRPFQYYVDRFSKFLEYRFPKIIFIQKEHLHYYKEMIERNKEYPTFVIFKSLENDIRSFQFFDEIQKIRTNRNWFKQAAWLEASPQAKMELYNPMVMSKVLWTKEASLINPFRTNYFLWIDGGHLCNDPEHITSSLSSSFFSKYLEKFLITFFDYQAYNEIHGFEKHAFAQFIDDPNPIVRVGRGGIFGGTPQYLEVVSEIYLEILGATLAANVMGTEENIFSILYYRFPELVHDFENGDHGNCAIFYQAVYGPPIVWDPVSDGFDLRGLTCIKEENNEIRCYAGKGGAKVRCPAYVTPRYLTEAADQWICMPSNMKQQKSYCTVECTTTDVFWFGHDCNSLRDPSACPPYQLVPFTYFYDDYYYAEEKKNSNNAQPTQQLPHQPQQQQQQQQHQHQQQAVNKLKNGKSNLNWRLIEDNEEIERKKNEALIYDLQFTNDMKKRISQSDYEFLMSHGGGFNLRGLKCEIEVNENGKKREVCFLEYKAGRDRCPDYVDSLFLSLAPTQWSCQDNERFFCTVSCQEGTDRVAWTAFEKSWCLSSFDCPSVPPIIPFNDYKLPIWSLPPATTKQCDHLRISDFLSSFPKISVGVLARGTEYESLKLSLQSWNERGFIQFVDEFLVYVNERNEQLDSLLEPFTQPPYNVKIMGDETNYGIIKGINYLVTNATNDYFLFLEKDFRLVESLQCALDQISVGADLLDRGIAHVIKYRSRYNAGRPNWAEALYRGKENTVWQNQPNLLCNFYHWIENPESIWPDHFDICFDDPRFYCVVSRFCNWTNNPFLIHRMWWITNYIQKFSQIANSANDFNLETWMNHDPAAWDDLNWIIAEGDGLFKHCDANNFGF